MPNTLSYALQKGYLIAGDNVDSIKIRRVTQAEPIQGDPWTFIREGNVEMVRRAIQAGQFSPNARDTYGNSALANAAARGQLQMVRMLIQEGATVPDQNAEYWAGKQGGTQEDNLVIKGLVSGQEKKPDFNSPGNDGSSPK